MTLPNATLKSLLRNEWEMRQLAVLMRDGLAESNLKTVLLKVYSGNFLKKHFLVRQIFVWVDLTFKHNISI
jgi:hypothetical protein